MSIKDKIIFGLLIMLIAAGGYFQWMANDMKARMTVLNTQDNEHLDVIDREFREDLRKLNLRFEGRGKHIRRAQQDIIANTNLINTTADTLNNKIHDVQWNLEEHSRITDRKIERVNQELSDLQETYASQFRRTRRRINDLEQTMTAIQNQIKEMIEQDDKNKEKK